jgi:hypothetical protein
LVAVDTESTPNGELSVGEARRTFLKNQTCFKIREKEKGKNRVDFCSKRLLLTSFGGQQMCLNLFTLLLKQLHVLEKGHIVSESRSWSNLPGSNSLEV